ncbi:shikimate dehydrogenase [Mariprofundus sp. EBB-1]|uniref:shikimate dehydrogenase family protein n=1 Tax=Mariprofundus sp. EBB-1 TaxID=2650971 RepID=UPI000EF23624|nr:shikimate dehydrogenase [Mariprofundus sp. EBB-1]RLL51876.1 shikimate dehydrogenase [Mariprofundus sp. EBB-1]
MNINGTTKTYGIIGWPVEHSLSPRFQSRFIEANNINAVYVPFGVAPELLTQAMHGLWALGVEGFNVTVPHKESIFQMVDADADARKIGAVNTVRRNAKGWLATNTDWRGFKSVVDASGLDMAGKEALLFGAGGTSRAVLHALNALNVSKVNICNRNPERLAGFLRFAKEAYPTLHCQPIAWQQSEVSDVCRDSRLLINTTSIGLKTGQEFPFVLCGDGIAMDAVYRPDGKTTFVEAAALAGRLSVDGLPMLIAQGAASFAWWHDCDMPDFTQALHQMQQDLKRQVRPLSGWAIG